jgi:hypothetical protein
LQEFHVLQIAQPICALLVTLITAFDVWLKPGAKYRAHYIANDEYAELRQALDLVFPDDPKAAGALATTKDEYGKINLRLRKVIPEIESQ